MAFKWRKLECVVFVFFLRKRDRISKIAYVGRLYFWHMEWNRIMIELDCVTGSFDQM